MHLLKSVVMVMGAVLMFAGGIHGQGQQPQPQQAPEVPVPGEISDEELVTFIEASDAIQPIQEEAQASMMNVIEEEGMEVQRFQQIMMAMQNPQMADQVDITPAEEQSLQAMQPKLLEIEVEATGDIQNEINEKGLEVERYQAIFMSLQQHPELMQRLEVLLGDN